MRALRFAIVFFIILVSGGFFYVTTEIDFQAFLLRILEHSEDQATVILVVIAGLTIFSTLTGLPVFYFSVAIGFFFPFLPALGLSFVINLVAIMITYIMVRRVFSASFRTRYGRKKMVKKINQRISKYGLWTAALSRSVYIIPTNILNFSFPLSRITPKQYFAGTAIGLVPECIVNAGTGYLLKHQLLLLTAPQQDRLKIFVIGGFLILIVAVLIILRYRKKKLERARIRKIVPMPDDE